jgi:hypothetical protein
MPRSFHIPFRCLASHSFRRRIIAYCQVETQQRGYVFHVSWSEGILPSER